MAGWIGGEGVFANLALDRAAAIPGGTVYRMLGLLEHITRNAIPPTRWDQMRRNLHP